MVSLVHGHLQLIIQLLLLIHLHQHQQRYQNVIPTTLTITINPLTTPTFNVVDNYCYGDQIPALPTTSINGIAGTWSPAIDNTTTTTYTFTPTSASAPECAIPTTLTITITLVPTHHLQMLVVFALKKIQIQY